MGETARRLPSYDDVLALPDGMTGQILGGELHVSPRPRSDHAWTETQIGFDLEGPFGGLRGPPGGWWILREPELHLGDPDPRQVVAVPDLGGWRQVRMTAVPRVAAFTLPPDWVCEVLSPGPEATRRDRVRKPDEYAAAGIPWLWLVDPVAELLEICRLTHGVYARVQAFSGDDRARAEPFEAVELNLSSWWLRP